MKEYTGTCSCGGVKITLRSELSPKQFQPRSDASTCNFCKTHDGIWISDPAGALVLDQQDGTTIERFASKMVEFHFCNTCREVVYAVFSDPQTDRKVGVARLATFGDIRGKTAPVTVTNFEGETISQARERRLRNWTPVESR